MIFVIATIIILIVSLIGFYDTRNNDRGEADSSKETGV